MNGKGDSPRNCFSKNYKDNYDQIEWENILKKKIRLKNPGLPRRIFREPK
tara:strand:- start:967 stop:1116 length:150 start_codon:yes stop_codon:yes gene_type:complete